MNLDNKTALVTGGAGFIGSHLVDALARTCRVVVLDDLSTGKAENLAHHRDRDRVRLVQGDVRDQAAVAGLLRGVDVVFHLACRGVRHSIGNPIENSQVNATGTLVLLEEARRVGVGRFVHVSSSEVYGTARAAPMDEDHPCYPETVYGAAKLAGEAYSRAYFRTYGLPTTVVRPFNNFGPRSHHEGDCGEVIPRFAVWALNGMPPVIFGDGTQTRDFIYVEDTAHWLCRVAECEALVGETVNLGSGTETSVKELAALVCEEAGQPGLAPRFLPSRPGDVMRHLAGVARARATLGFATRTSLREGVRKLLGHLKAQDASGLLGQVPEVNWGRAPDAQPTEKKPCSPGGGSDRR
jgi:UDP-glucose 4-epimerase